MNTLASPSDLIYFIEVATTLNISRTAKRIGISQPSLTLAVQRLEHLIGTPLLIRGKSGVTLTPAGKRFLSHAKELLQLWDSVKSETLAAHYEVQGKFTLGVHPSVALTMLSRFIPTLLTEHPKLELQLKHDLSRNIAEDVINLVTDIGIVVNPVKHPDLIIHKLYDDKITFWHTGENAAIQQIESGEAVLIFDPDLVQTQSLLKRIQRQGIKYHRVLTGNNLEVIAKLTANGSGIGILPTRVALAVNPPTLVTVPNMPHYKDEICLIYRPEKPKHKSYPNYYSIYQILTLRLCIYRCYRHILVAIYPH